MACGKFPSLLAYRRSTMAGNGFEHKDADGHEIHVGDRVYDITDSARTIGIVRGFFGGVLDVEWTKGNGSRHRGKSNMKMPADVRKV